MIFLILKLYITLFDVKSIIALKELLNCVYIESKVVNISKSFVVKNRIAISFV